MSAPDGAAPEPEGAVADTHAPQGGPAEAAPAGEQQG